MDVVCYHDLSIHHSEQSLLCSWLWKNILTQTHCSMYWFLVRWVSDHWEGQRRPWWCCAYLLIQGGSEHAKKLVQFLFLTFHSFSTFYTGIAFHRRAQTHSQLERTFWLKEETPATVNLDGKKQQKGDMNSKYRDKWHILHIKEGIVLLLQRPHRKNPCKKRLENRILDSGETQIASCDLRLPHQA